jgi:DNA invertase Pin-like site-specific DNA recombinase
MMPIRDSVVSSTATGLDNTFSGPNQSQIVNRLDADGPYDLLSSQTSGAVAQFERSPIAERVRSGLANARANRKVLGRPPLRKLTPTEVASLRRQRVRAKVPFRTLAKDFGISVCTAHRLCAKGSKKVWTPRQKSNNERGSPAGN